MSSDDIDMNAQQVRVIPSRNTIKITNNHNHKMNKNEIIHDELSHESGSTPYSSVLVYYFLFSESHFF